MDSIIDEDAPVAVQSVPSRRASFRSREVVHDEFPKLSAGAFIADMDALLSATYSGRPHTTALKYVWLF